MQASKPTPPSRLACILAIITAIWAALPTPGSPGEETRVHWQLDESYSGPHRQAFEKLRFRIPTLVSTAQLELAARMGLDYRDGFRYPLTVGFTDEETSQTEYPLAYVRLTGDRSGIRQRLSINLDAYEKTSFDFQKVLYHEMAHVILSDAAGADAFIKLPVWLVEGLALWVAGQGEKLVRAEAHRYPGYADKMLVGDLDGPRHARLYPQYFLAVHYIVATKGVGALQNILRDLVGGRALRETLAYHLREEGKSFEKNVQAFSADYIRKLGTGSPFEKEKPY